MDALCSDVVTPTFDPWFSDDDDERQYARHLCNMCPIQATCAVNGLVNGYEYGIFGGLTPEDRDPLRDKMFKTLPPETIAELNRKYFVPDLMEVAQPTASTRARRSRRVLRAEYCYMKLRDMSPADIDHYERYMDCVNAVLDHPEWDAPELGKLLGISAPTFRQSLRACFRYFDLDLEIL